MVAGQVRLALAAVDDERVRLGIQLAGIELHSRREHRAAQADDAAVARDALDVLRRERVDILAGLHRLIPAVLIVVVNHDGRDALAAGDRAGRQRDNLAGDRRMNRRRNRTLRLADDLAHVDHLSHLHTARRRGAQVLGHGNRHSSRGSRVHNRLRLGRIFAVANLMGMDAAAKCLGSSHRQVPPFTFQSAFHAIEVKCYASLYHTSV